MSRLLDPRKTFEVKLPSYPDDSVTMYDSLTVGELREIEKLETDFDRGLLVIKKLIKSWTFTDENDKPLGISEAVLERLPTKDFGALMSKANEALNETESKKKEN